MHVISRRALSDFWHVHHDAEILLRVWFKAASKATFRNLIELKRTFGTVDYVPVGKREFYVFNIRGNKYRLVVAIHFNRHRVFVRHILTHADYDRGGWKK